MHAIISMHCAFFYGQYCHCFHDSNNSMNSQLRTPKKKTQQKCLRRRWNFVQTKHGQITGVKKTHTHSPSCSHIHKRTHNRENFRTTFFDSLDFFFAIFPHFPFNSISVFFLCLHKSVQCAWFLYITQFFISFFIEVLASLFSFTTLPVYFLGSFLFILFARIIRHFTKVWNVRYFNSSVL